MKKLRFVAEETNIDFIGKRKFAFIVSFLIIVGSLFMLSSRGINLGIDFTGGTMIEIRLESAPDLGEIRDELNVLGLGSLSIQEFGSETDILIRLPEQEGGVDAQQAAIDAVHSALDKKFGEGKVDYRRTEFVGPQVGKELKKTGALAVLFSLIGILVYVWFRFEWQFGVAAIVALAHDAIATIGLFSLTQMEFNLSTVAAILMIAGYSINDTVVVFDRIRENLRKYKKKALEELFNLSVNQMLSRTLMTSITTLLALGALWQFGGEVIQGFVNALIFGIVIGTYSSIYVASPVLLFFNVRNQPNGESKGGKPAVSKA
jgi:preprotein translocase subunit SecF